MYSVPGNNSGGSDRCIRRSPVHTRYNTVKRRLQGQNAGCLPDMVNLHILPNAGLLCHPSPCSRRRPLGRSLDSGSVPAQHSLDVPAMPINESRRHEHRPRRATRRPGMGRGAAVEHGCHHRLKPHTGTTGASVPIDGRPTDPQAASPCATRYGSGSCGPVRHCRGRRTRSPASLREPEACGNHSAA